MAVDLMKKRIILNGIELSLSKYNASAITLFDYLDDIVTNLEEKLSEEDGNFKISIDVDFSASKPPKHKIYPNGKTNKSTQDKVSQILEKTKSGQADTISGSVKVNLQIEDRQAEVNK